MTSMVVTPRQSGKVLLCLEEKCLIIANTGEAFSQKGVEAVCNAHRSAKTDENQSHDRLFSNKNDAKKALEKLRTQRLKAYQAASGDIEEHVGGEASLKAEYAGRLLLELLQNAHDAAGEGTLNIGEKGIGFKGVLNISRENISIHSGHLHLGYSVEKTRKALEEKSLPTEYLPTMRLPFWKDIAKEGEFIQALAEEYTTVIVLPFAEGALEKTLEKLQDDFRQWAQDETLLLFLPALQEIAWQWQEKSADEADEEHPGTPRKCCWQKTMQQNNPATKQVTITRQAADEPPSSTQWQLWQHKSAQLAMRLNEQGAPQPEDYPPLRAYFATEEENPLPLLLHAHFPLKAGRDHIEHDAQDNTERYQQCLTDLATVITTALQGQPCATMLDCLKPGRDGNFGNGSVACGLWEAVREKALQLKPSDARGLALSELRLPPLNTPPTTWEAFKAWLVEYRPGGLNELPFLPLGAETNPRQGALHALQEEDTSLTTKELQALPLLPLEEKDDPENPCRPDSPWVLFPPLNKKKSPGTKQASKENTLPKAPIPLKFLSIAATKALEGEESQGLKTFMEVTCWVEFYAMAGVVKAVQAALTKKPAIAEKRPKALLTFLQRVYWDASAEERRSMPSIPQGLSHLLRVQTREKDWQLASTVYAGKDWVDGNEVLERMYADSPFLAAPKNQKEKDNCRFYRWLWVAFCPKELPIVDELMKPQTKEGLDISRDGSTALPPEWTQNPPKSWDDYCQEELGWSDYQRRMRQNSTLDGGSAALKTSGAFERIASDWEAYKSLECRGYKSSNAQRDNDNNWFSKPSHLHWLFQNTPWVPAKGRQRLQLPSQVFQPGGVTDELAGLVKRLDMTEAQAREYSDFLSAIGVRSGWTELIATDWQVWLERDGENSDTEPSDERKKRIKILLRALLKHASSGESVDGIIPGEWGLWAVNRRADNTEEWRFFSPEEKHHVYYLDRPDLTKVCLNDLWVLPVMLDKLEERAKSHLGIEPLSQHLQGTPMLAKVLKTLTEKVHKRLQGRWPAILAFLQKDDVDKKDVFPVKEALAKQLHLCVVEDLQVGFVLAGDDLGTQNNLPAYYQVVQEETAEEGKQAHLWLEKTRCFNEDQPAVQSWEWLAKALCYCFELDLSNQANIKDLLLYKNEELSDKLIDLGITSDSVQAITRDNKQRQIEEAKEEAERIAADPPEDAVVAEEEINVAVEQLEEAEEPEEEHTQPGDNPAPDDGGEDHDQNQPRQKPQPTSVRRVSPFQPSNRPTIINRAPANRARPSHATRVTAPRDDGNETTLSGGVAGVFLYESTKKEAYNAQDWMACQLKRRLPDWQRESEVTYRFNTGGRTRTDIVLSHPVLAPDENSKFHIEVKHTKTGYIHWSYNQLQMARVCSGRYLLVVLSPDREGGYDEFWFCNPLEELKAFDRKVQWGYSHNKKTSLAQKEDWDATQHPTYEGVQLQPKEFVITLDVAMFSHRVGYSFDNVRALLPK